MVVLVITCYIGTRSLFQPRPDVLRKDPLISPVQVESLSSRGIQLAGEFIQKIAREKLAAGAG